jgi:enoyl-CoA hydratase/carnithine racemase
VGTNWQTLKVSVDEQVGRIVLNRPEVLNALNLTLVVELERAVHELEDEARVILIEGAGTHFCAGADMQYLCGAKNTREFIEQINRAFFAIENAPVPVIVAVQGFALAGGFELMQACDVVMVAHDAIVGDQHANFGLIPGGGGTQRLPRLIGRQRALALLLTGERLSGKEVFAWGLAYRSVPFAELHQQSLRLAQRVATKSRGGLKRMKALVDNGAALLLSDAITLEVDTFLEWLQERDAIEGLDAFRHKRTPHFK